MAYPSYQNCLAPGDWEGKVRGIEIKWHNTGREGLPTDAAGLAIPEGMAKAMTEHFAHATAARLGRSTIRIMGSPHTFTRSQKDNKTKEDEPHITASSGSYTVHIYLDNYLSSSNTYNWENVKVKGENVVAKGKLRADLSYGSMTGRRHGATSGSTSATGSGSSSNTYPAATTSGSSSYYNTAPATTATYGSTGSTTTTAGATTGRVGEWQFHETHNRRYRTNPNEPSGYEWE